MFTNKHVVIAMIVAPILAVLAWMGVGQLTSETPHEAVPGQSYPLVEKSNCRYASGACDLENEDVKLRMTLEQLPGRNQLVLTSSIPLEGVLLAVAQVEAAAEPVMMRAADGQGLQWRLSVNEVPALNERIRLVASAVGSSYFADAGTVFLHPEKKD
jgi:hypothetical protein